MHKSLGAVSAAFLARLLVQFTPRKLSPRQWHCFVLLNIPAAVCLTFIFIFLEVISYSGYFHRWTVLSFMAGTGHHGSYTSNKCSTSRSAQALWENRRLCNRHTTSCAHTSSHLVAEVPLTWCGTTRFCPASVRLGDTTYAAAPQPQPSSCAAQHMSAAGTALDSHPSPGQQTPHTSHAGPAMT